MRKIGIALGGGKAFGVPVLVLIVIAAFVLIKLTTPKAPTTAAYLY